MQQYEVILLNDKPVVREGITSFLASSEFRIVASVDTIADAKLALAEHPHAMFVSEVQVVRRDPRAKAASKKLVTFDCLPLLKEEKKKGGNRSMLVVTISENPTHVARAAALGAFDYVVMSCSKDELLTRMRCAVSGEHHFENAIDRLKSQLGWPNKKDLVADLTPRETQTLNHLVLGLSNAEIAMLMDISIETVKEHVQHLLRKMGVNDRTQAAVWLARKKPPDTRC